MATEPVGRKIKSLSHMKINVKETCVVQKDLVDILQDNKDSKSVEGICNRGLRRSLTSILEHDRIRTQLLEILAFKPFQGIITASSLNSFARLLKAGAKRYLSNAFRRILDFWKEIPPSSSLVKWLEGRWGCEITEEAYKTWSETTSEDYPEQLLDKIRNQSCRIITLRIVIAESRAFHFFIKSFTPTATLDDFLGKVSEYTSDDHNAPKWTSLRQVSQPRNGIWSQKPHKSIKDLYPTTRELLISGGKLSIKALFQDFVMVFFGASAYNNLGPSQDETTVRNDTNAFEHIQKSVSIEGIRKRIKRSGMVIVDNLEEVSKAFEYPEGLFRVGCVCHSPPLPTQVCHKSQKASLLDAERSSPPGTPAHSHTIRRSIGAATGIGRGKSTGNTWDSESIYSREILTDPYTEKVEVEDIEDVNIRASVAVAQRQIGCLKNDTNDVILESKVPVNNSNVIPAISNPTASKIAESFRADAGLVSHIGDFWESDATTLNEPETPIPDEGALGDMVFTNVRLVEDKDPNQFYLVPGHVTKSSELIGVIQERCRHIVAPEPTIHNNIEDSRREAAIALYGKTQNPRCKHQGVESKFIQGVRHMLPRFLRQSGSKASAETGPFHIR
ncbi:MAG: hypothetical protein Q9196_000763 [Gyalolechia fulgens]